ncbi:phospholipase A1 precursor [Vibrio astriarenae]|nr:phospholipase A1 precursor [Vibrio sp. C7]
MRILGWSILLLPVTALSNEHCRTITSDEDRLACYDAQFEPPQQTKAVAKELDSMTMRQIVDYGNTRDIFKLTPHRANYVLPLSYNQKPNQDYWQKTNPGSELDRIEVKFQISGKLKLWKDLYRDWDLWFGYTQTSWWQLYNGTHSAPFRETNYSPELILSTYPDISVFGFDLVQTDYAFIHHSNGEDKELSRSWNRLYANLMFARDNYIISLKPWYRVPDPDDKDDNPNIQDYMGYGEIVLGYRDDGAFYSLLLRNNLTSNNKGAVELNMAYPIYKSIKLYAQYYYGYGESLIDFDHKVNRFSLGVLLYDVL